MKNLHNSLRVLARMFPQASVRSVGTTGETCKNQLHWHDESGQENSVTFFEGDELAEMKKMAFGASDIQFVDNLRFSSTN